MADANGLVVPVPSPSSGDCGIASGSSGDALVYRVAGLFAILIGGSVGFMLPFLVRGRYQSVFFLFRAFAAGVVLATGLVHVLPDAENALSSPCLGLSQDVPWVSIFVLFAALFTFTGEHYIKLLLSTKPWRSWAMPGPFIVRRASPNKPGAENHSTLGHEVCEECPVNDLCHVCVVDCKECGAECKESEAECKECGAECQDCAAECKECVECEECAECAAGRACCVKEAAECRDCVAASTDCGTPFPHPAPAKGAVGGKGSTVGTPFKAREICAAARAVEPVCVAGGVECVDCGVSSSPPQPLNEDDPKQALLDGYRATAITLEAGIIFHSIFVGIAFGTSHDVHYVQGLTFALVFHQGFEGLSLGSALVKAQMSNLKVAFMALAFALTTPVGIAIGLAIGNSYNENSPTALAIEGSFNAASAGILLYAGLVDLVMPAFDPSDPDTPQHQGVIALGFLSMFLGAGCMSLLAKWA